ncbi:unnamed protein product [Heterobilharzia americana]|nr:unnamed protein product [Heterobilharzia americana]
MIHAETHLNHLNNDDLPDENLFNKEQQKQVNRNIRDAHSSKSIPDSRFYKRRVLSQKSAKSNILARILNQTEHNNNRMIHVKITI